MANRDSPFGPQRVILLPQSAPTFDFFTAMLYVESTNIYHCVDQSKLAIEHHMKFGIISMKLDTNIYVFGTLDTIKRVENYCQKLLCNK